MTGLKPPSLPRSSSSVDCVKPDTELSIDDDLPRVLDCGTTPKAVCRGGGKGAMCGMGAIEGTGGDIEVDGGHIVEGCDWNWPAGAHGAGWNWLADGTACSSGASSKLSRYWCILLVI